MSLVDRVKGLLRSLAHLFGHAGHVESDIDASGAVWVGLRCSYCGKLIGHHRTRRALLQTKLNKEDR